MINNPARATNVVAFRQKKHYLCTDYTILAMRKIAFSTLFVVCLMFFSSCSFLGFYRPGGLLDLGYDNEYGQYVPKRPKYKLKDKKGHILLENLDTINIYCRYYYSEYTHSDVIRIIKFYPEGRFLEIFIFEKNFDKLKKDYLNPRDRRADMGYYYSKDGKKGLIEIFEGDNQPGLFLSYGYSHRPFSLNSSGDTLSVYINGKYVTYIKEIIPETWEKYPVDW